MYALVAHEIPEYQFCDKTKIVHLLEFLVNVCNSHFGVEVSLSLYRQPRHGNTHITTSNPGNNSDSLQAT